MTDDQPIATVEQIATNREKIMAMERAIQENLEPVTFTVVHHFSPGVYARELHIPAGTILTGKIHLTRHLNIISAGTIEIFCPDKGQFTVSAPFTFVSDPGTKRVGYAWTDTVWTTIHPTDETDPDEIERQIIAQDFDDERLIPAMEKFGLPIPKKGETCHLQP